MYAFRYISIFEYVDFDMSMFWPPLNIVAVEISGSDEEHENEEIFINEGTDAAPSTSETGLAKTGGGKPCTLKTSQATREEQKRKQPSMISKNSHTLKRPRLRLYGKQAPPHI